MHIIFVQTGDYREAVQRFAQGEPESYSDQRNSVEYVARLVNEQTQVTVICTRSDPYDEVLDNGVRAIGLQEYAPNGQKHLFKLIRSLHATHLVLRMPNPKLLKLGLDLKMDILPIFADSFTMDSLRQRYKLGKLARLLNHPKISIVSNHNISASKSLAEIGVDPDKVIPYDFPRQHTPANFSPKSTPRDPDNLRMVYVGAISEPKGVFDILKALPILAQMGIDATLSVIGEHKGALDQTIKELGVVHQVQFMGRQPNARVIELMREHDAVVVPSQHAYPEGLPHTIFEAIATRTPLIASDHPMFTPILDDAENCVMFEASDPNALAKAVGRLIQEPGLYGRISSNTDTAWNRLMMPVVWHEVVDLWLSQDPTDAQTLSQYSLVELASNRPIT
tara:strand:+ start:30569 stop:31747 length:1179 start_codon:yes stop_codon:yes gene_type:complete